MQSKNLYVPFRALGLVCDGLQSTGCSPVIHKRGLLVTITTPVDGARALHCYSMNLKLRAVSKPVPSQWLRGERRILNVAVHDDFTYAAFGPDIVLYRHMQPYVCWHQYQQAVSHMLVVGNILVTVSALERRLLAFRLPENYKDCPARNGDVCSDIALPKDFDVTALCHPPAYVNKVLLGGKDGRCLLLNLRTRAVVHEFASFHSAVTVLEPSPALDVVAVGLADGRVLLHNFKFDETVACYEHGAGDELHDEEDADIPDKLTPIRAISFRTGGPQMMVVSDRLGNLVCWDLNERRMLSAALRVHRGGVAIAQFLDGEPVLVTAGRSDNSIKVHLFDGNEGEARLLRYREGHKLPPTKVRFCGRSTNMMVSVGLDRELRLVSTVQDSKNKTFSQAGLSSISKAKRKRIRAVRGVEAGAKDSTITGLLPVVTSIASSTSKLRFDDFANIVTAHANREQVYTWQSKNARTFQHVLVPKPRPGKLKLAFDAMREGKQKAKASRSRKEVDAENRTASCVTISPCGNFAVVGSVDGRVHMYNLQSGTHMGAFEQPNEDTTAKQETQVWGFAHDGPVAQVAVDGLSDILLTAGSQDKTIKFWKLRTRQREEGEINCEVEISSVLLCQRSDLVAVSGEDFMVYIYDGMSHKLARVLRGHQAPITDVSFAESDGRRLVSASMDGTLRTWDLVSGLCVDVLRCSEAPTSVVVAPRGAFIATTHVNNLAVVLWVDQSRYIPLDEIKRGSKEGFTHDLELPMLENVVQDVDDESDTDVEMDESTEELINLTANGGALAPNLVTFSGKPAAQWSVLSNLNAIRERNKPLAPPKKPENVPFFLPTVKGLKMKFDVDAEGGETKSKEKQSRDVESDADDDETKSKEKQPQDVESDDDEDEVLVGNSDFGKLVKARDFDKATQLLHSLQPSGVDVELRMMEGKKTLRAAANYFLERLKDSTNFELTQAHMDVFLKAHGLELAQVDGSAEIFAELLEQQEECWRDFRQRMDAVVALTSHFSGQI